MQATNTVYWIGASLFRSLAKAFLSYRVINRDALIQDGPCLIVANHESFVDPPLIGVAYDEAIHYLARKTLFRGPAAWLYPKWNAIPVDQERPDMTGLKKIIKILKSGHRVLLFPEGERTQTGELGQGAPGVGLIVSKARVPVQPVRIVGARDVLPRGSGKFCCKPVTIVVGEPIEFTAEEKAASGKAGYQMISDRIMKEIGKLG